MPHMSIESRGTERKLRHLQPPQIDSTSGVDTFKHSGRLIRHEPASDRRATLTGSTTPIEQILVRHRYPAQRSEGSTRGATKVNRTGSLERLIRIAGHHTIQTGTN